MLIHRRLDDLYKLKGLKKLKEILTEDLQYLLSYQPSADNYSSIFWHVNESLSANSLVMSLNNVCSSSLIFGSLLLIRR